MHRAAGRRAANVPAGPLRLVQDHARALNVTIARLGQHATGTVLTLCVIAIVLSLPATLAALLHDLSAGTYQLGQQTAQTTLYLRDSVTPAAGEELAHRIAKRPGIAATHYISRDAALAEFKQHTAAATAVALLASNPLPASIVVTPDLQRGAAATQAILHALTDLPEVAHAQLDPTWTRKLYAGLALIRHVMWLVMGALALTVLMVIGNTVRLEIEDRRHEIAIMKLVGASNAYVRRPFLYTGMCYGLGGAAIALLLVMIGMQMLEGAIGSARSLTGGGMALAGPDFGAVIRLLGAGLVLGWLAAAWTVSRHLHRIEPG